MRSAAKWAAAAASAEQLRSGPRQGGEGEDGASDDPLRCFLHAYGRHEAAKRDRLSPRRRIRQLLAAAVSEAVVLGLELGDALAEVFLGLFLSSALTPSSTSPTASAGTVAPEASGKGQWRRGEQRSGEHASRRAVRLGCHGEGLARRARGATEDDLEALNECMAGLLEMPRRAFAL